MNLQVDADHLKKELAPNSKQRTFLTPTKI